MNEVLKAIHERNSCRDFSPEPLDKSMVETIADAALAAPSAMNAQPWRIIVVTDKNLIDEYDKDAMTIIERDNKELLERMKERGGTIFYNAPCIIFILKNNSDWAALDCGIVTQNIALAAHSLGLGNVICGMARITLGGEKGEDWKKRLNFPEGFDFAMSVAIGRANSGKTPHELDKTKLTFI